METWVDRMREQHMLGVKIYLSGPISNMPDNNKAAFDEAAEELREWGYEVINPIDLDLAAESDLTWEACMKRDIKLLMDCDGIMLLDGWHKSAGAQLEFLLASRLGLKYYFYDNYKKGMYKHALCQ